MPPSGVTPSAPSRILSPQFMPGASYARSALLRRQLDCHARQWEVRSATGFVLLESSSRREASLLCARLNQRFRAARAGLCRCRWPPERSGVPAPTSFWFGVSAGLRLE